MVEKKINYVRVSSDQTRKTSSYAMISMGEMDVHIIPNRNGALAEKLDVDIFLKRLRGQLVPNKLFHDKNNLRGVHLTLPEKMNIVKENIENNANSLFVKCCLKVNKHKYQSPSRKQSLYSIVFSMSSFNV